MGCYDALSASLVEQVGGEVVYISGSSVATSADGYPDVGVTPMTGMMTRARWMVNGMDVPVFCDADTGYRNPVNVFPRAEVFQSIGIAGIHVKDPTFPKRYAHFEERSIVPTGVIVQKTRTATDARDDDHFLRHRADRHLGG